MHLDRVRRMDDVGLRCGGIYLAPTQTHIVIGSIFYIFTTNELNLRNLLLN
jgi:hypothetical protein